MCASFLIPFGQTLGEAGAGISAGQGVAADLKWKQLNNQLLEQQLKWGGMDPKVAAKAYLGEALKRQKNLEISNEWARIADQLQPTDPQQAARYRLGSMTLKGTDGMGSLEDPTQVALNLNVRTPQAGWNYQQARTANILNPAPKPFPTLGPGGMTVMSGLTSNLDPNSGTRTLGTVPLPPMGGATTVLGPEGMPPPIGAPPTEAPPTGDMGTGGPATPPTAAPNDAALLDRVRNELIHRGFPPDKAKAFVDWMVGAPVASPSIPRGALAPSASPTRVVPIAAAPTKPVLDPPPPDRWQMAKAPPPIPRAFGGVPSGDLNNYLRPKLSPPDALALGSLNNAEHQLHLLFQHIMAMPPSQRKGWLGSLIAGVRLKAHKSGGAAEDALLAQIGATRAALISGFQQATKTRAIAAVKMVQDHYPDLGDEPNLLIHKLEQLIRPDGYLNFARNSLLYGPDAAAAMAPINELTVAPPGSMWDASRRFSFKDGTKGIVLDGSVYRQDVDGYWVEIPPRGRE